MKKITIEQIVSDLYSILDDSLISIARKDTNEPCEFLSHYIRLYRDKYSFCEIIDSALESTLCKVRKV
jgi:hypothetical protein